jgi:hypothetical protein
MRKAAADEWGNAKTIAVYSASGVPFTFGAGTNATSTTGRGSCLNTKFGHMGVLKAADDLFIKK